MNSLQMFLIQRPLYHGNRLLIDPTSDLYKEILPTRSFPLGTHFFGIQIDGVQSLPLVDNEPQSPTYRQILGPRIKVI
jgi:hypothetical protein